MDLFIKYKLSDTVKVKSVRNAVEEVLGDLDIAFEAHWKEDTPILSKCKGVFDRAPFNDISFACTEFEEKELAKLAAEQCRDVAVSCLNPELGAWLHGADYEKHICRNCSAA